MNSPNKFRNRFAFLCTHEKITRTFSHFTTHTMTTSRRQQDYQKSERTCAYKSAIKSDHHVIIHTEMCTGLTDLLEVFL